MQKLKFKTTIKCSGCVAMVAPVLDENIGKDNWQIDLQAPEKFLTIDPQQTVNEAQLLKAIESTGYKAERVS
ncbi:heavy-metal-associated domain-containing protein [Flavitalea sp.]|nr:heavy-metal-associated domain-containing protein [Flavitalea sp.]